MSIPEAQLDTWAKIGAVATSRATDATIKNALDAADAAYTGKDYSVFLQGSYGNDTNVWAESDVDVVIVLNDICRRYHQFQSLTNAGYTTGICVWNGSGVQIANYPKQHSENLTIKHQATHSRLKPTIRISKNMRNRMVQMAGSRLD